MLVMLRSKWIGSHHVYRPIVSICFAILRMSTLPPQRITATFLVPGAGYLQLNSLPMATATPTPALGSMQTFNRSHTILVARKMSSSDTDIISSTKSRIIGHVLFPRVVLSPSATLSNVLSGACFKISPVSKDRFASSNTKGSAKIIWFEDCWVCVARKHSKTWVRVFSIYLSYLDFVPEHSTERNGIPCS